MNDDDRKMIEEAEKLDAEAPPGPWRTHPDFPDKIMPAHGPQIAGCIEGNRVDDAAFIARSRELLPALAKRLREALDHMELDRYLNVVEADAEALSLASSAGFETARRGAIAAIQKLPEWPVANAEAERREEVDRVKAAYPVKEYIERVANTEATKEALQFDGEANAEALRKPRPRSLEELLEAAKDLPEMTAEQRIEQKVSWVFGQNALASSNHLSKGEVAGVVYKKAFEEVLADLRVAVKALKVITDATPCWEGVTAKEALAAIKTKGL